MSNTNVIEKSLQEMIKTHDDFNNTIPGISISI